MVADEVVNEVDEVEDELLNKISFSRRANSYDGPTDMNNEILQDFLLQSENLRQSIHITSKKMAEQKRIKKLK